MKQPNNLSSPADDNNAQGNTPLDTDKGLSPPVEEEVKDQEAATPDEVVTADSADQATDEADAPSPEPVPTPEDENTLYGTVEKTWTSGGVGGTGAQSAMITARYLVKKDLQTGIAELATSTFELIFTDIDNETTARIPAYSFKNSGETQIPQAEDDEDFTLNGTVHIATHYTGRLLFVNFDMSAGAPPNSGTTPRSLGAIFAFDIPYDTEFAARSTTTSV